MEMHSTSSNESSRTGTRLSAPLRTLTGMSLAAIMVGAFAPSSFASPAATASYSSHELLPASSSSSGQDDDQDQEDSENHTGEDGAPEIEMEGTEMILVMDASGSMNAEDAGDQTRIAAAKDALSNVVDSLEDHQNVGLRVFAGEVTDSEAPEACEDSELVVEIGDDNRDELRSAIDDYEAVGARTPLAYALEQAAADLGDEGNRTIVLVSDGEENCAPDPCEAAETIAEQGIDVAIHTVGFQIEDEEAAEAREQLQCIAETGGGDYYDASDAETLTHTLERISHRAFMPFSLHGEEVEPGSNQDNAPVLEPGAQYVGAFEYETMYYRIPRSMENSTLHVGIATYNDSGDHYENAEIELTTMGDNRTCGRQRVRWWGTTASNLFRTAQVAAAPVYDSEDNDAGCGENDELLLAIHSGGRFGEGDDILGQPFELLVEEEPDPVNGQDYYNDYQSNGLPWDGDDFGWIEMERDRDSEEQTIAGSSLNNAPKLEAGTTYDTDILPGEIQVYRIDAEWGQQLQAEAFFPEPDSRLSDELLSNYTNVHMDILSPYRGAATPSRNSGGSDVGTGRERISPQNATTLHRYSHPVWWPNRYSTTGSDSEHSATIDGEYYLVISADPADENTSFSMPYRLTADTFEVIDSETPQYSQTSSDIQEEGTAEEDQPEDVSTETAAASFEGQNDDAGVEEPGGEDNGEPVAAEQTGFFSGTTGVLVGLGAFALLLMAAGGLFLARVIKTGGNEQV
ncbi:vWA domain-containing protein [Nesterenkonia muleiensis]|uniref:vWA domain-containing protein n=1 Tax=Nesterenkonia muleiensis TaxID=2282648 RepID=UPI000E730978|nr:VWA domain-containing protein [Nesterenkonia muleiensis]